jgi:DNA-binding NtrC family response regulator
MIKSGYDTSVTTRASEALQQLEKSQFDLVIADSRLPGMSGVELTGRIVDRWPNISIIAMTRFGDTETAAEVLKLGASDFVRKPYSAAGIQEAVKIVLEQSQNLVDVGEIRNDLRERERCEFGGMLSRSHEMHRVFETIKMAAATDVTVVVEGETGTGKDLVARAVHRQSLRKDGPLVAINCAGVPEALLESELFGYERGAFTGADRAKPGKIELAHGGTLFLDEIESMPLAMQAKLLLVLENQKVQRLGSNRWAQVDMRVVAATNVPLKELRAKGLMRTDFYYRLNVVLITLLPLRQRSDDIPLLVYDFLQHHPIAKQKQITKISSAAMRQVMAHSWPGNIRELQNVLEKALVLCRSRQIENVDIPDASPLKVQRYIHSAEVPIEDELPLDEWVRMQEKAYLVRRLRACRGKIGLTAHICGVDVRTIHRKMRLHGLDKNDFCKRNESRYSALRPIGPRPHITR